MTDPQWVTLANFWVSLLVAALAFAAITISYWVFRSQVDPCVVVYAAGDERRSSIIVLVAENIGKAMARDISFSFSRAIPEKAWGFLPDPATANRMSAGPFVLGIPALPPGGKRVVTWGQFGGLYKDLGEEVINVTVTYKSLGAFKERHHEIVCPLEVWSFKQTDATPSPESKIAHELEKVVRALEQISVNLRHRQANLDPDEQK